MNSNEATLSTAAGDLSVPVGHTNVIYIGDRTGLFQIVAGAPGDTSWDFHADYEPKGADPKSATGAIRFPTNTIDLTGGDQPVVGEGEHVTFEWTLGAPGTHFRFGANPYHKQNMPEIWPIRLLALKDGSYYFDFDCAVARTARWNLNIQIGGHQVTQVDLIVSGNDTTPLQEGPSRSFTDLVGNSVGVHIQGLTGPMKIGYMLTQIAEA